MSTPWTTTLAHSVIAPPPLPSRNRLLPIPITPLKGRNPRIHGFGRGGVGGWGSRPRPSPTTGTEAAPQAIALPTKGRAVHAVSGYMRNNAPYTPKYAAAIASRVNA